ncbi:uncharacterized protein J5F26_012757 isoform 1-T5 [Ciconia maguari]
MAAVAAGGRRVQRRGAAARRLLGAREPPAVLVGRPPSSGRAGPWRSGLRRRFGRSGSGAACSSPASPPGPRRLGPAGGPGARRPPNATAPPAELPAPGAVVAPVRPRASSRRGSGGVPHASTTPASPGPHRPSHQQGKRSPWLLSRKSLRLAEVSRDLCSPPR